MRRAFFGLAGPALIAAALLAVGPAQAQSVLSIGTVDMGRINGEYQAIRQFTAQYEAFVTEQQARLDERSKTRMLKDEEVKEFNGLSQFAAPTDANKQRLEELAMLSDTRERRLGELEAKTRDAGEETEFDNLTAISTARRGELQKLQDDARQLVSSKRDELVKVIKGSVDAAIKAVAEQKKLSLVLAKAALVADAGDAPVVLYGGSDITDEVLAKLNASPVPTVGSPAPAASAPTPGAGGPAAPAKK